MFKIGTRVIAARFTLIGNQSVQTNEFGTVVGFAGLGFKIRFDRDGHIAGAFESEILDLGL